MGIYAMRCIWECNLLKACVKPANVKYLGSLGVSCASIYKSCV